MTALTNNHRLGGLQQHTFILLQYWGSKLGINFTVPSSGCHQSCSLWRLWGGICFLVFSCLWSCPPCMCWLLAPPSTCRATVEPLILPSHRLFFCVRFPSISLLQGHLWWHLNSTQINQDNLISKSLIQISARSLFSYRVIIPGTSIPKT